MAGLTALDIEILRTYASDGNRELYWNYLAQKAGADGYGLLALGVVRNDSMPGAVANHFADNRARQDGRELSEREWERFGEDLILRDFALRSEQMANHRPDLALNLPVDDVQRAHGRITATNSLPSHKSLRHAPATVVCASSVARVALHVIGC